jgi:hypothetical protein
MERNSIDCARFRSTISGSDEHCTLDCASHSSTDCQCDAHRPPRLRMRGGGSGTRDGAGEGGTPQKRMISCSNALVELPAAAASPGRGSVVRAGIT